MHFKAVPFVPILKPAATIDENRVPSGFCCRWLNQAAKSFECHSKVVLGSSFVDPDPVGSRTFWQARPGPDSVSESGSDLFDKKICRIFLQNFLQNGSVSP
jgi:hypothetical protein